MVCYLYFGIRINIYTLLCNVLMCIIFATASYNFVARVAQSV